MFKKEPKKDALLIRALQWASDRGSVGFKLDDLKKTVANDEGEWTWVQRMLLGEIHGNPVLIAHLGSHHKKEGEHEYFITAAGASTLIDYIALKEARASARTATIWATVSFGVSVVSLILGMVIGGFQIWSTYLTQDSLDITKQILQKEQDPLITYEYNGESFRVNAKGNVLVRKVDWVLVPNRTKINEYGNDLTLLNLKNSLLVHMGDGKEAKVTKSFIDCYILGSEFYRGIPMVVAVEFRRQGSIETFTQVDLVRIRGSERDGLYVYVEKPGVSIEEVNQYAEESKEDFEMYRKFLEDYEIEGECGIYFGTPPKEFW